jgi:hypothetical protein
VKDTGEPTAGDAPSKKLHEVILRARMERAQEGLFDPRCAIPASLLKPKPVLLRESGTDDMTAEGDSFPPDVAQKLKTYVYRLIDPRNGETFYVGRVAGGNSDIQVLDARPAVILSG